MSNTMSVRKRVLNKTIRNSFLFLQRKISGVLEVVVKLITENERTECEVRIW